MTYIRTYTAKTYSQSVVSSKYLIYTAYQELIYTKYVTLYSDSLKDY